MGGSQKSVKKRGVINPWVIKLVTNKIQSKKNILEGDRMKVELELATYKLDSFISHLSADLPNVSFYAHTKFRP